MARAPAFAGGGAIPFAVLFDLILSLPLLYHLVVLRPAGRPLLDAAPALTLGAVVAGALLATRPETRLLVRASGVLAEAAVLALLVRRLRVAARQLQSADRDDFLLRVASLTDPLLRVAGMELAVLYYAFVGPRRRRALGPGEFGYTEDTGLGGLLFALGFVVTMEGLAVHLLIHSWSPAAAWVLAAANVYTLIWLAAAYQAARLRPVALSADRLLVRTSLLWTAEIPRAAIASVTRIHEAPRGKGVLRAALAAEPALLVTLRAPVIARGPLGIRRSVTRIALHVDEPERLRAALRS